MAASARARKMRSGFASVPVILECVPMEREVLLHVQPVGENEHEGNAEFVIVQSFQLFFVNFHGEFPALFSKAPGEGNGVIVLVDRIRRILDVNIQSFDGLPETRIWSPLKEMATSPTSTSGLPS